MGGCSEKWEVELYNLSDSAILVTVGTASVPMTAGNSALLRDPKGDVVLPGSLSIAIGGQPYCYDVPAIWSSGYGEFVAHKLRIRLMVDRRNLMYVYAVGPEGFVAGRLPGSSRKVTRSDQQTVTELPQTVAPALRETNPCEFRRNVSRQRPVGMGQTSGLAVNHSHLLPLKCSPRPPPERPLGACMYASVPDSRSSSSVEHNEKLAAEKEIPQVQVVEDRIRWPTSHK